MKETNYRTYNTHWTAQSLSLIETATLNVFSYFRDPLKDFN